MRTDIDISNARNYHDVSRMIADAVQERSDDIWICENDYDYPDNGPTLFGDIIYKGDVIADFDEPLRVSDHGELSEELEYELNHALKERGFERDAEEAFWDAVERAERDGFITSDEIKAIERDVYQSHQQKSISQLAKEIEEKIFDRMPSIDFKAEAPASTI